MNKFEEKSKRDLLEGLRMTVNILEADDGFALQMNGKIVNKERAAELRRARYSCELPHFDNFDNSASTRFAASS